MAGIYLHIPFCKTRCIYCDFYSNTQEDLKDRYIQALCTELRQRRSYLNGEKIETIYFGGGTPSQLQKEHFEAVFQTIQETYDLSACHEITLEANPDDLHEEYVEMLTHLPFNRVSMGIQTFQDDTLKLLNRRHNAAGAKEAIYRLRGAGFHNISIDLIYGLPGETIEAWQSDLQQALDLNVEHISSYLLSYEKGTRIYKMLQQHLIQEVNEDLSLQFYTLLMDELQAAGYNHYEISNFCKPGFHSRHNTSYWQGIPYLGCGPSAHSFNRTSREWNVASIEDYITGIEQGKRNYELETLDAATRYNEYLMTGLRTAAGISLQKIEQDYGTAMLQYCKKNAAPYVESGRLCLEGDNLRLSRSGIFISNSIISDMMYID